MILSNKGITKVLIRLGGCAGWSVPLLFAISKDWFSRVKAHMVQEMWFEIFKKHSGCLGYPLEIALS